MKNSPSCPLTALIPNLPLQIPDRNSTSSHPNKRITHRDPPLTPLTPLHSLHPHNQGIIPRSLFQTYWKAGGHCTQVTISLYLQAHRWFSGGGKDPTEALSSEVRLSFVAAA